MACRIFFPQNKGLNLGPSSESTSPNHCTAREFPGDCSKENMILILYNVMIIEYMNNRHD